MLYIDGDTGEKLTYAQHRTEAMEFGNGIMADKTWAWRKGEVVMVIAEDDIHSSKSKDYNYILE